MNLMFLLGKNNTWKKRNAYTNVLKQNKRSYATSTFKSHKKNSHKKYEYNKM